MARSFRPVKVIWGENSSCFLHSEDVERVLEGLAEKAGCEAITEDVGDTREVWISDGAAFLNYIIENKGQPAGIAFGLGINLVAIKDDDLDSSDATEGDFKSLWGNLQAMAPGWLANDLDPKDGSIRFYIDQY